MAFSRSDQTDYQITMGGESLSLAPEGLTPSGSDSDSITGLAMDSVVFVPETIVLNTLDIEVPLAPSEVVELEISLEPTGNVDFLLSVDPEPVVAPEPEASIEVTPEPVVAPEPEPEVVAEVTPEPEVVVTDDFSTIDSTQDVMDIANEEIGTDSQSLDDLVNDLLLEEASDEVDPLTELNFVGSQSIQKSLWSANFTEDSSAFKGVSGDGDYIFRISDSNDRRSDDMLTGVSYGLALVETGTSLAEAMESNDYIISNPFDIDDGMRSFVSMDSEAVSSFIDDTDNGLYTSLLINLDTMEVDMSQEVGDLTKQTSRRFDRRIQSWDLQPIGSTTTEPIVEEASPVSSFLSQMFSAYSCSIF